MGEGWDGSKMVQPFNSYDGSQAWGSQFEELAETTQESWDINTFLFPQPVIQQDKPEKEHFQAGMLTGKNISSYWELRLESKHTPITTFKPGQRLD